MTLTRAIFVALIMAGGWAPVWGQEFDAVAFYGEDCFVQDDDRPGGGKLQATLNETSPDWIDFSGSGLTRVRDRFEFTPNGMVVTPDDEHGSCEALIDLGATSFTAEVQLIELDKGGTFAWHLYGVANPEQEYLVEIKALRNGTHQLQVRVKSRSRYVVVPDTRRTIQSLVLPLTFEVSLKGKKLSATTGTASTEASVELDGASIGLAVSDERARLGALSVVADFHSRWLRDATARLAARQALERLSEVATTGLLAGIKTYGHPDVAAETLKYSEKDLAKRSKADGADIYVAAKLLHEIATTYPKNPIAQHEAGVAALMAGQAKLGRQLLVASEALSPTGVTLLALAEAERRLGQLARAEEMLEAASENLPETLRPDFALIKGRLLADTGQLGEAHRVLTEARKLYPEHAQLDVFADSAIVLLQPPTLSRMDIKAPFGLTLVSDLPADVLERVMSQLDPHMRKMRLWLPDLEDDLQGIMAIFASPVEYLRAALLVAGDHLDNVAGTYLPMGVGGKPTVMGCRAFGEDELVRTLIHEIWHLALASTGRAAEVPRWLNEGMAVFLSAGEPVEGVMRYTRLPSEFDSSSLTDAIIERALTAAPYDFYQSADVRGNYLAAWAVTWHIATGDGGVDLLRKMLTGNEAALKSPLENENLADTLNDALNKRLQWK